MLHNLMLFDSPFIDYAKFLSETKSSYPEEHFASTMLPDGQSFIEAMNQARKRIKR
jgi:hypothetical protein